MDKEGVVRGEVMLVELWIGFRLNCRERVCVRDRKRKIIQNRERDNSK